MTAAQKTARANFKKAVAEAKKIRKKNPKLSQAQAVKQAWAIIKKGKKSKVGDFSRSGTKVKDETGAKRFKKPDYKVKRTKTGTFVKWAKVGAIKKVAKKKSASKKISTHKDTRSHNVNIRVMSGLSVIKGTPHKSRYYVEYINEDGHKKYEYFDKLPKGYYVGNDRVYYIMRLSNKGTTLTPLHRSSNGQILKKK